METISSALLRDDAHGNERRRGDGVRDGGVRVRQGPERGERREHDVVDDLRGKPVQSPQHARAKHVRRARPRHADALFERVALLIGRRVEEPGAEHARVRAGRRQAKRRGGVVVPRRVVPSRNLPGAARRRERHERPRGRRTIPEGPRGVLRPGAELGVRLEHAKRADRRQPRGGPGVAVPAHPRPGAEPRPAHQETPERRRVASRERGRDERGCFVHRSVVRTARRTSSRRLNPKRRRQRVGDARARRGARERAVRRVRRARRRRGTPTGGDRGDRRGRSVMTGGRMR